MRTHVITLEFGAVARAAGFAPAADGKLNLPPTQDTYSALARAAVSLLPAWETGSPALDVILTGPGPVWGYAAIWHALHGRAARCRYSAPNADIVLWSHGVPDGV